MVFDKFNNLSDKEMNTRVLVEMLGKGEFKTLDDVCEAIESRLPKECKLTEVFVLYNNWYRDINTDSIYIDIEGLELFLFDEENGLHTKTLDVSIKNVEVDADVHTISCNEGVWISSSVNYL